MKLKEFFKNKYVIFYIGTILFFAIIYTFISNQFYYSTISFENNFYNQKEVSMIEMEKLLNDYLNDNINKFEIIDVMYYKDSAKILDIDFNNKSIVFSIQIVADNNIVADENYTYVLAETLTYIFKIKDSFLLIDEFSKEKEYYFMGEIEQIYFNKASSSVNIDIESVLTIVTENSTNIGYRFEYILPANENILKLVNTNFLKIEGFTNEKNFGTFFRMLYFSIVTGSTLGYGDILPLTTLARTLVTLEVIACVVVMGLFLNSLSSKSRE